MTLTFWKKLAAALIARVPLLISSAVTALALAVYYISFVGARTSPFFEYIERLELASVDLRFKLREDLQGPKRPDPRVVIVDIDQHTQEVLGRWPFARSHFVTLLDKLREDGARVVAFDITFSQPDPSKKPIEVLRERVQQRAAGRDPSLQREINAVEQEFDYDARFAEAIERFGKVVLGNFFLFTQADLRGMTPEALERSANLVGYYPFPQVRPGPTAQGAQSRVESIRQLTAVDRASFTGKVKELLPQLAQWDLAS